MRSLTELQQCFVDAVQRADGMIPAFALAGSSPAAERIAIYRRTIGANYRNALGATYPVVQRLVGTAFFHAAVDHFVREHPSRSGDLNEYGDAFGAFLAGYRPAAALRYLADVARLEWAIDEANRARDFTPAPDIVLGALTSVPPERLSGLRLMLEPSCRLLASAFPVLRIWQVHQPDCGGELRVPQDCGPDHLRVRREPPGIALERIAQGEFAWLAALGDGAPLAVAIERAQGVDVTFDLGTALHRFIGDATIAGIAEMR